MTTVSTKMCMQCALRIRSLDRHGSHFSYRKCFVGAEFEALTLGDSFEEKQHGKLWTSTVNCK